LPVSSPQGCVWVAILGFWVPAICLPERRFWNWLKYLANQLKQTRMQGTVGKSIIVNWMKFDDAVDS
jgi:hypothetical protein